MIILRSNKKCKNRINRNPSKTDDSKVAAKIIMLKIQ